MKCFLIANNDKISEEFINNINISPKDIVVLFNHQFPIKFKKIKNHKNKFLIMRKLKKNILGYKEYLINKKFFKKTFIINHRCNIKKYKNKKDKYSKHKFTYLSNKIFKIFKKKIISYPQKQYPSTGFFGFIYFKYIFNKKMDINLIGFDSLYKKINKTHNFPIEQKIYSNKNVKIININIKENNNIKKENCIIENIIVQTKIDDNIFNSIKNLIPFTINRNNKK
jgi:hypothetical protein